MRYCSFRSVTMNIRPLLKQHKRVDEFIFSKEARKGEALPVSLNYQTQLRLSHARTHTHLHIVTSLQSLS